MSRIIPEQLCPVALPHEQALQVRASVDPVYQVAPLVPAWQVCAIPSNMAHFGADVTGMQACPAAHPPPTVAVAQNRLVVPQVTAPGWLVPWGVHEPLNVGVNVPTWTPRMLPPTVVAQLFGVVQACVELKVVTAVPGLVAVAQSVAVV
jgi:hypothetical protein